MSIPLLRGGASVNNFFSAVGSFKETNFTAYIAYLLSIYPEYLGRLILNKREEIEEIFIEAVTEDRERYDIFLTTTERLVVIEAKLGFKQIESQITKYVRKLIAQKRKKATLCLLDDGSFKSASWTRELRSKLPRRVELKFVTWSQIFDRIKLILKYKRSKAVNNSAYYIAKELINYMEANNMSSQNRREVYVRDLGGDSIELFFRYKIYKSQTKFYKSAQNNLYFAPYFIGRAPKEFSERSMIKIQRGISWIAPIRDIQCLKMKDIAAYLKAQKYPKYKEATKEIYREVRGMLRKELMIMVLGDPFLAFLTPITKDKLKLYGAMGSRNFTFEELFTAAGKGD